jgi:hypothetical protein
MGERIGNELSAICSNVEQRNSLYKKDDNDNPVTLRTLLGGSRTSNGMTDNNPASSDGDPASSDGDLLTEDAKTECLYEGTSAPARLHTDRVTKGRCVHD